MATDSKKTKRKLPQKPAEPEPAWEIARLFPAQGDWSEEDYFALDTIRLVEFCDGFLEFLPMPTIFHQLILQYLFKRLEAHVTAAALGTVIVGGYKIRLRAGKYREPDVLFVKSQHRSKIKKQYCEKADLVIEIVSEKNRLHDIKKKRLEYARAGIPEYWIVDPERGTITVLFLKSRQKTYSELGVFVKGTQASSRLLPGFTVDVSEALSQKP
jgi:Uma2 family endonuclease